MTMGEKWLCEVRIIHYIVVFPKDIFPETGVGEKGKPHSLTVTHSTLFSKLRAEAKFHVRA